MIKNIYLKRLELSNWRGQNHTVNFSDVTTISGQNGVGKSTIMKAWYWLLTSYTAPGDNRNSNLFDNREELSPNTPRASVTAIISIDGTDYEIKRMAESKFIRKKGTDAYEKAPSDMYYTFIDGLDVSSTAFNQWISDNICPIDMLPFCLDGGFFTDIMYKDKTKARGLLGCIIGNISISDMSGDYSLIEDELNKYSVSELEERLKAKKKPLEESMERIPYVIDEKNESLSEYASNNFDDILSEINLRKKEIEDADNEIAIIGESMNPIRDKIREIDSKIMDKRDELNQKRNAYMYSFKTDMSNLMSERDSICKRNDAIDARNRMTIQNRSSLEKELSLKESSLISLNAMRESLIKKRDEVKARVFSGDKCAYCGHELTGDKVEEAREKFNNERASELDAIVSRGKSIAKDIELTKGRIEEIKSYLSTKDVLEEKISVSEIDEKINAIKERYYSCPFESTDEYANIMKEIEDLENSKPVIPDNDIKKLTERKRANIEAIEVLNRRYGIKARMEKISKDIEDLREERRRAASEIASIEGKIALCKAYKQEVADIISTRVNMRLSECRIDMWSTLKDGTIVPDMVLKGRSGINFVSLNFSDQIRTKIQIQEMFMSNYGISLPIFVDEYNVFSSNNTPDNKNGQIVRMCASDVLYLSVS